MIPLFDMLAHPTLSGHWLGHEGVASFEALVKMLEVNGYVGACAVGLADVEGYADEAFAEACGAWPVLTPIAGVNPRTCDDLESLLKGLKAKGFKGIKVHPRFSGLDLAAPYMVEVFRAAGLVEMPVFFCTYYQTSIDRFPAQDPFYGLVRILKEAPDCRVVLVHGGGVELLRYAELVRFNRNLLLDLSLTMCKYAYSSIDADIRFLFERFDERICIGTDHPEWAHAHVRQRFDQFSLALGVQKKENIAYKNAMSFLGLSY